MGLSNFHTHTTFCDGRDTPEAMVRAALQLGFDSLGFSSHSDMLADPAAYRAEIRRLQAAYAGRLRILCGIEAEFGPAFCRMGYDYVIGSVHYVTAPDGARVAVDDAPEALHGGIAAHFGGDAEAFVKAYFETERRMLATFDFDIAGHLDLVRKFNAKAPFFDESAPWYLGELEATADALAARGKIAEVNTGAIARGWLDDAYPSPEFRGLLRERGVRFILSSDAHAVGQLAGAFDRFAAAEDFVLL